MFKSKNNFKWTVMVVGALTVLFIAPGTAFAGNDGPSGPGGCTHTNADGAGTAIRNGQDVLVDGKIVSCRRGSIVVTMPPERGNGLRGPLGGGGPMTEVTPAPQPTKNPKLPVINLPVLTTGR